jgi:hypothetical protein
MPTAHVKAGRPRNAQTRADGSFIILAEGQAPYRCSRDLHNWKYPSRWSQKYFMTINYIHTTVREHISASERFSSTDTILRMAITTHRGCALLHGILFRDKEWSTMKECSTPLMSPQCTEFYLCYPRTWLWSWLQRQHLRWDFWWYCSGLLSAIWNLCCSKLSWFSGNCCTWTARRYISRFEADIVVSALWCSDVL